MYQFSFIDWALAPWVQRLIGANRECYAHEYSSVDPKSRFMEMKSINLTFCSFVNIKEQMSYYPHPEDHSKTLMRQETIVTVKGVPLTRYVEPLNYTLHRLKENFYDNLYVLDLVINT